YLMSRFFFTAPLPASTYPLSLHDALPIFEPAAGRVEELQHAVGGEHRAQRDRDDQHRGDEPLAAHPAAHAVCDRYRRDDVDQRRDRKSTRLNSSHVAISYAVFCLKQKTTP